MAGQHTRSLRGRRRVLLSRFFLVSHVRLTFAFLAGLVAIDFVFRFIKYLELAAESAITGADVWTLLALKLGVGMTELLPLSLYLATFALVIGLRRTNEFVAMLAGGYSAGRMLRTVFAVSVFTALAIALVTLYVEPEAETRVYEIRNRSENEAEIAGVRPGVFRALQGDSVFYAKRLSDSEQFLEEAFVETMRGDAPAVSRSERAYVDVDARSGERVAVFESGTNYAGEPGRPDFTITEFERHTVVLERKAVVSPRLHENYRPTLELIGLPTPRNRAELHWRVALPIAALVMPLIAFAIAVRTPPQDWHLNLVVSMALYFLYKNLLGLGRSWLKDESVPAFIGLWWVHAIMLAPALVFLYFEIRPRPILRKHLSGLVPAPLR